MYILCLFQDVIGCTTEMDFFLWPRNDIEKIQCLLFSRWKGDESDKFKPIQVNTINNGSVKEMLTKKVKVSFSSIISCLDDRFIQKTIA